MNYEPQWIHYGLSFCIGSDNELSINDKRF